MRRKIDLDPRLFTESLSDPVSPEVEAAIERWRAQDPEHSRFLRQLQRSWAMARTHQSDAPSVAATLAPLGRAYAESSLTTPSTTGNTTAGTAERAIGDTRKRGLPAGRFGSRILIGSALIAAVAVLFTIVTVTHLSNRLGDRHSASAQRYSTAPGQRATVHLSNGSTILLAPATTVAVTSSSVEINGEARFAIVQSAAKPLTVLTTNAAVRVLGTAFVVRHYADESRTSVVVEDGKVAVLARRSGTTTGAPAIVTPRMLAQVTDSGVTVTSGVTTRAYTSWAQGTLFFDGVVLGDVVAELSRAYGVRIQVPDKQLAKQVMRLEVSVTEQPIRQVLDLVGLVVDAHVSSTGQTYVLSPGRGTSRDPDLTPQRHQLLQPELQYGK